MSEDAADAAEAISDDGARITTGGEGTQLVVVGEDSPLHRGLVSIVAKIFADVGEYTGSAVRVFTAGVKSQLLVRCILNVFYLE
jgi:hypothetical protein